MKKPGKRKEEDQVVPTPALADRPEVSLVKHKNLARSSKQPAQQAVDTVDASGTDVAAGGKSIWPIAQDAPTEPIEVESSDIVTEEESESANEQSAGEMLKASMKLNKSSP